MLLGNWDWDNGKAEFKTSELKVNYIVFLVVCFLSAYYFFVIMNIFEVAKLSTIDLI